MKFGKRLALEAARRWRPFYLDYKACKRAIQQDVNSAGAHRLWLGRVGRRKRAPVHGHHTAVVGWHGQGRALSVRDRKGLGRVGGLKGARAALGAAGAARGADRACPRRQTRTGPPLRPCCARSCRRSARFMLRRRRSWRRASAPPGRTPPEPPSWAFSLFQGLLRR